MEGFEKITCMNELKLRLSCEASQPLLYYFELHCHIFRISSFYQLEIKKKKKTCGDDGDDDREQD